MTVKPPMDRNTISESPTFCPAPWNSLNIDQTGRVSPCLHFQLSVGNIKQRPIQEIIHGAVLNDLRQSIVRGEWHKGCAGCQQSEKNTGSSARTVRTVSDEARQAIDTDINWVGLEHIVVNWSNLCNLSCVYCNPQTSTAWQQIKGIPINHVKNDHEDLIELAKEHGHTIRGLLLGGGEPLLQKGLADFLKHLHPEQVRVVVTTNLSIDLTNNPIYQELRHWPNVDWQISFDNVDADQFEYVRNGASWEKFVDNIQQMKQDQQKIIAHPAYSIYCAFNLVEYYQFCTDHGLDIFWCDLTNPWDLDVRRLPAPLRNLAIDEIDQVVKKYKQYTGMAVNTLEQYRMNLLDNSYLISPDYTPSPLLFHDRVDRELNKKSTFQQLWPELTKHLKEHNGNR